jgi:hypothetical protein
MTDRLRFAVSVEPIETIVDENSGDHDILASEVNKLLAGSGDGVDLAGYGLSAAKQGQKDAAPYYVTAAVAAGGTPLNDGQVADGILVKNTGRLYSSSSVLGLASVDYILVAIRIPAGGSTPGSGGWEKGDGTSQVHFIELAFLAPGQAFALPLGASKNAITQLGSNANDLTKLNEEDTSGVDGEGAEIVVKTVESDGTLSAAAVAVEFLCVT